MQKRHKIFKTNRRKTVDVIEEDCSKLLRNKSKCDIKNRENYIQKVIKRRSVANEVADNGRVVVNGKIVKPSYEVKPGDILEIQFGDKTSKFEILSIPKVEVKNISEIIKLL